MTEEKKIEEMKQYLSRYAAQQARVDWQKKKIEGLKMIMMDGKSEDDDTEFTPAEDIGYDTAQKKLTAEKVELCKIYSEITEQFDALPTQEMRDVLYGLYIDLDTQEDFSRRSLVHVKTVCRRHRQALVALYDIMHKPD